MAGEQRRRAVVGKDGHAVLPGNSRGPLSLRWVHQQVPGELSPHRGHVDILPELVFAARPLGATHPS